MEICVESTTFTNLRVLKEKHQLITFEKRNNKMFIENNILKINKCIYIVPFFG